VEVCSIGVPPLKFKSAAGTLVHATSSFNPAALL
jgi:hypothetical protein